MKINLTHADSISTNFINHQLLFFIIFIYILDMLTYILIKIWKLKQFHKGQIAIYSHHERKRKTKKSEKCKLLIYSSSPPLRQFFMACPTASLTVCASMASLSSSFCKSYFNILPSFMKRYRRKL